MAAPGKKFSFRRFITNAIPNFARDDPNDVNLSPKQADELFECQLLEPHPRYLTESSFLVAGIAGNLPMSKKVHKALVKNKIILPPPLPNEKGGELMTVNTAGVTKNFANQLAVISVHAQRKLVGMLFFWEEELTRLKLLDMEEREILGAMEGDKENADLRVALDAVRMKKKLLPSKRGEGTANVGGGHGHELPSYS